ncbi:putative peter pan protein [Leishmania major strain Friedlin]|uniref:Putative peter pan protein n=1 Tax=Leishmania major TaxID=5664 RepID=E9ACN5_LEIMA|nr:putative peter pan protein [Leishmania major strain Friedlin]CAG9567316.1 peter_pan_protein_-_putative [Leishmania major strain Friedlin]CBZ12052.1 putative peter pan protein [Leishmania major strain Friedlin]|eukprot:XP_003721766.1 putative peter pan protein [Leishmania major strain Friedlin]
MGKAAKGRTAMPGKLDTTEADKRTPKSIIIYRGEVGIHVRSLMHEWRNVFLPWSSKKLHGKNKSLKDFLAVAATFSASHLQLFTAPSQGTSLRIMRFFNGPTLSFRVLSFTLHKEIVAKQRRPVAVDRAAWEVAPIVVLNNFTHPDLAHRAEVPLLTATFKALFPSLNVQTIQSSEIQRICLFHYDHVEHVVEVRHYYINARTVGVTKTVKKLLENRRPTKLGTLESIDEVLDREDAWSDTDGEGEEVPLVQPFRQHREQCRVKLQEIGPRMTLQLSKVENGFAGGEVIYHRTEKKTLREVQVNASKVRARKTEKAKRRALQDENVQRKRQKREDKLERKHQRREAAAEAQQANPFEVAHGDGDGDGYAAGDEE